MLVVLHHAAMAYSTIPSWYYTDPGSGLIDVFVALNQTFSMGFFFLISGFFTPGSHDSKGARTFLRGRLVRLGVPLAAYLLLLHPALHLGTYLGDSSPEPYWRFYLATWGLGPMWFLEVLLVFSLVYALVRRIRPPRPTVPAPAHSAAMPGPAAVIGFLAVLAAATYLWRIAVPVDATWQVTGLPTPGYLPQYALMFAAGVLAFRKGWLNTVPRWAGRAGACAAVAMAPVYILLMGTMYEESLVPGSWQSLMVAAVESTLAVSAVLALLALFQRLFNRRTVGGAFLSDQAYAVYFLHPLVIVGLNYGLSPWEVPAVADFAVVAALCLPLCWGAAYLLRRLPGAKRVF
ncbi:acyltransferase [Streptomonospora alba]|uniref:Acyltransferase n=1 Tax=Streptomonospora alba TaxID=183763 RepID=A0A0C2JL29_9ACTN|nr:acyltransferase [Streptomonospora alba]